MCEARNRALWGSGLYNSLCGLCVQDQAGLGLGFGVPEPIVC